MIAIAISVLFASCGLLAATIIADTLLKARTAYGRLMREGEMMRAAMAWQAGAAGMGLRPAPRPAAARPMAVRRPGLRSPALRACAAA